MSTGTEESYSTWPTKPLMSLVAAVALFLGTTGTGLAAAITGAAETPPVSEPGPALEPENPASLLTPSLNVLDPNATVIEFSIVPSDDDPTQSETIVILRRDGGKKVCVNLKNKDLVVRSYRVGGEEPFTPTIPGNIRGLTSGDVGDIIGFNETKVFIRPNTPEDTFANPDECFIAGEAEACFVPEVDDCDEVLDEGEFACVAGTISADCSIGNLTELIRQMRILAALNQPPGEEPIITEAGIADATDVTVIPDGPGGDLPSGEAPGGPTAEAPPESGGGGSSEDLVRVPNVLGSSVPAAVATMTRAGLTVGTVTLRQVASLDGLFIKSAQAQAVVCPPNNPNCDSSNFEIDDQGNCPPDSLRPRGTICNLSAVSSQDIPEPGTFYLLGVGLVLLALIAWRRRRA